MKKIAFVLAAAGLMSIAACTKPAATAENNSDLAIDNVEVPADNMDAMTDNSANATAADLLDNATADNAVATNL